MPMSCSGDSFRSTRHPLITFRWYIILIYNKLQSQFTRRPKKVTSGWRVNLPCKSHILSKIQRFGWWVGDECFEMNHRCNQKSHNNLQRWGWRVAELYENSFFQSVVSHHVRVWRLILKNAKADFAMFGLQVYFFRESFYRGVHFYPFLCIKHW